MMKKAAQKEVVILKRLNAKDKDGISVNYVLRAILAIYLYVRNHVSNFFYGLSRGRGANLLVFNQNVFPT